MPYVTIYETYRTWSQRMKDHGTGDLPFCIAFCGVFSSGKTSIINQLLNSSLPTGINPVTKVVTRIRYGERIAYYFIVGGEQIDIPSDQLNAVITGKQPLPRGSTELLIEMPADLLKNNVEIIDTPGYEDNSALEDMSRTAVLTADLILFCTNALILGKEFEKEYLQELSKSHGNFCLVVNRIDSLNTDEEYQNVCTMAERMVQGQGSAFQGKKANGQSFFTVGAGRYATLNGLDAFLNELISDSSRRKAIRNSTNQCFTEYNRKLLSEALNGEILEIEQNLHVLNQKNGDSLKRVRTNHELLRLDLQKDIQERTHYVQTLLTAFENTIGKKFQDITTPRTFSELATNNLYEQLHVLQSKVVQHANKLGMDTNEAKRILDLGTELKIPAPVADERVTRGTSKRLFNTIGNWLSGDFSIDDGRSWVWMDYQNPAIQYVRTQVIEQLQKKWKQICQCMQTRLLNNVPAEGEYTEEIARLQDQLHILKVIFQSIFSRMTPGDASVACSNVVEKLAYMQKLVREYRSLVELLSMPGAFIKMLDEHLTSLLSMQKDKELEKTDVTKKALLLMETTFTSMCRAYVTLGRRPNNPEGAERIFSQMMEDLANVYSYILDRGALAEKIIEEYAYK